MEYVIALIIHILSIVIWIGGVAFVTMVTFPMILRVDKSLEQVLMFQGVEHRFAGIAKVMVILAGLSGFYLVYLMGLSFAAWMMIFVWAFYASLLFGLEKLIFKKIFSKPDSQQDTRKVFLVLQGFHWFVLALSFLAIVMGIYEAHY